MEPWRLTLETLGFTGVKANPRAVGAHNGAGVEANPGVVGA
jgi:hypothetical protein